MNNEKILDELNDKLDYMLDHLEDYTDNDIKSIVNQMNETRVDDKSPWHNARAFYLFRSIFF